MWKNILKERIVRNGKEIEFPREIYQARTEEQMLDNIRKRLNEVEKKHPVIADIISQILELEEKKTLSTKRAFQSIVAMLIEIDMRIHVFPRRKKRANWDDINPIEEVQEIVAIDGLIDGAGLLEKHPREKELVKSQIDLMFKRGITSTEVLSVIKPLLRKLKIRILKRNGWIRGWKYRK